MKMTIASSPRFQGAGSRGHSNLGQLAIPTTTCRICTPQLVSRLRAGKSNRTWLQKDAKNRDIPIPEVPCTGQKSEELDEKNHKSGNKGRPAHASVAGTMTVEASS